MITIQELGLQILNHQPHKFYIFGGAEYGIKMRYIEELEKLYGKKIESDNVSSLIAMMNTRHIIPLEPTVYVVRYDESFVSSISDVLAAKIKSCKIVGTIVCIYEQEKHINKFNKYLPEYTAIIDPINPQFVKKYIQKDFPNLAEKYVDIAVQTSADYNQAKNIAKAITCADSDILNQTSDADIIKLIGYKDIVTEDNFQTGIASRNFYYLMQLLDCYDGEYDNLIYCILQTMIELDKQSGLKYSDSKLKPYTKLWKREDIYWMFMHGYDHLSKIRSNSTYDSKNAVIFLFSLLKFTSIPAIGAI